MVWVLSMHGHVSGWAVSMQVDGSSLDRVADGLEALEHGPRVAVRDGTLGHDRRRQLRGITDQVHLHARPQALASGT